MAVTQLARKGRVNRVRSAKRRQSLKLLTARPVIKNIDIESIKKEFEAKKSASSKPSKKKVEEAPVSKVEETPASEEK